MGLKTIERIGPLLDLFTVEHPEWELGEAAAALGLPRSTAHGLMSSLVTIGLLASPTRGRYRLGDKVVELGNIFAGNFDIRAEASEAIHRLAEELGETVNLGVLRGRQVVYLDKVAGHQYVTVVGARVGAQIDAGRTAMGKVLLAFAAPETRLGLATELLQEPGMTPLAVERALAAIREQGWAVDLGEVTPEIRCVAAPIRNARGRAVAAISISTTVMRFERRRTLLIKSLLAAAGSIEQRLST